MSKPNKREKIDNPKTLFYLYPAYIIHLIHLCFLGHLSRHLRLCSLSCKSDSTAKKKGKCRLREEEGPITEFKVLILSNDMNLPEVYFIVLNGQSPSGRKPVEDEKTKLEKQTSRRQDGEQQKKKCVGFSPRMDGKDEIKHTRTHTHTANCPPIST